MGLPMLPQLLLPLLLLLLPSPRQVLVMLQGKTQQARLPAKRQHNKRRRPQGRVWLLLLLLMSTLNLAQLAATVVVPVVVPVVELELV